MNAQPFKLDIQEYEAKIGTLSFTIIVCDNVAICKEAEDRLTITGVQNTQKMS